MSGRPRTGRPRRSRAIKILVTPELEAAVIAAAERDDISVSSWGKRLFEREVERSGGPRYFGNMTAAGRSAKR